jgi:hypothetical protein
MLAAVAALAAGAAGCDEGWSGDGDSGTDVVAETGTDVAAEAADDSLPGCTYPEGPYAFAALGDTAPPMSWPSGVAGLDETLPADLAAIRCAPGVNSIFILVVNTT